LINERTWFSGSRYFSVYLGLLIALKHIHISVVVVIMQGGIIWSVFKIILIPSSSDHIWIVFIVEQIIWWTLSKQSTIICWSNHFRYIFLLKQPNLITVISISQLNIQSIVIFPDTFIDLPFLNEKKCFPLWIHIFNRLSSIRYKIRIRQNSFFRHAKHWSWSLPEIIIIR